MSRNPSTGASDASGTDSPGELSELDLNIIMDAVDHGLKAMADGEDSEETTDTTQQIEETEVGYRMKIKSTRGTGTRDQDTVSVVANTRRLPDPETVTDLCHRVRNAMNQRRAHEPDAEPDQ